MKELNDALAIATEQIAEDKKGTPEELKVNKLQQLIESGASHQHIRRTFGLSARVVGQLFNTRVSKHNNKKRTTKAVRKKKRKAQKCARNRNRNNVKHGARTTKSSTSTRHRSKT